MMKQRVKVWDLAVRLTHGALAGLLAALLLTGDEDGWLPLHMRLGVLLLGVVLFRVVWGFVGSPHARFADFVRGPTVVLEAARDMLQGRSRHTLGHNPVGGVMVVVLLGMLLVTAGSGVLLALGPEWRELLPLSPAVVAAVKVAHEAGAAALPVLVVLHVLGVLFSSWLERQNLPLAMVTGWKRGTADSSPLDSPRRRGLGLVLALGGAAATALPLLILLPPRAASAAADVLEPYRVAAQQADSAFQGFDAARGRRLYLQTFSTEAGPTSCATCHTEDPTQPGRSPAGKRLLPLAPSANPQRLSDARTVEKWLGRNCKQVLGRLCTARESGDVLTFLLTTPGAP